MGFPYGRTGRYRTKRQEIILDCLKKQKSRFLTVDQFADLLRPGDMVAGIMREGTVTPV